MTERLRLPPRQQVTEKFPVVGEREPDPAALDLSCWRLRVSGEVDQPQSWTYGDLQHLSPVEMTHDIHCVTRWSRLGCRWRGISLATLINHVCPTSRARFVQFVAYSSRQHDSSLPLELCADGSVLLAWEMDGEPLSIEHGYPLRVVAPSRYFYKSVKWVHEIRFLSTDVLGYWERGGYHNNGDFWCEERYVSGNLSAAQLERLRHSGNFRPYRHQVLLSLDLSRVDFAQLDLERIQLKHCTLAGSNLQGANLRGANLTNSDLQGADLRGADLSRADVEGALFMGADLRGCKMSGTWLTAAEFVRPGQPPAQVKGLDLSEAAVMDLLEDQYQFLHQQRVI